MPGGFKEILGQSEEVGRVVGMEIRKITASVSHKTPQ